jgi:hypothetical protein
MSQKETVFLSSVSQGMEPYREAVYRAIEGLEGYHCVRMEEFGARDTDSQALCRRQVAGCTSFVGILGHQYGSTPPESDRSYSEMEYDEAVYSGIPRLMFLAPEDFPVQAHLIESDSKRNQQRLFRERVTNDRQVAFFSSEDQLGGQVLQAIYNCRDYVRKENSPEVKSGESVSIVAKTWLLFSFVTNQVGFDTGFSISNVSLSPVGTTPQAGDATLHFYGKSADVSGAERPRPRSLQISVIGAGVTFTSLMSVIAPGFQGYIVAECNFSPARGYAMITDIGAQKIGSGYLAEVINETLFVGKLAAT